MAAKCAEEEEEEEERNRGESSVKERTIKTRER